MPDRIDLDAGAIERLIHTARLGDLRAETSPAERTRAVDTAATALDALCGSVVRRGTDEVWDVLSELDRRTLLTFATFAISELSDTSYSAAGRTPVDDDAAD